jgi:hypothetical protein
LRRDGNAKPSAVEVSFVAWQLLKVRVRGDQGHRYDEDYDAAAAEHYMYIRFLAGHSGDPTCYAAPTIYGAKKVLDQLLGRLQKGQAQGGHPVLPANPYIVGWGHDGVIAGLADYKAGTTGAAYKLGNAIQALASFSLSPNVARRIGEYSKSSGAMLQSPYTRP